MSLIKPLALAVSIALSAPAFADITATGTIIDDDTGGDNGLGNFWFDANGGNCARQSTPGAYIDSQACNTLALAYEAAQCGDVVRIIGADYSTGADQDQVILEDASATACASNTPIVFRSEAGQRATFRHIRLGTDIGNCNNISPDNITMWDIDVVWGIDIEHDAHDIIIDGFDGGSFGIGGGYPGCGSEGGPTNVTIRNGDWGPCRTAGGTGFDCRNQYTNAPQEGKNKIVDGATNIVIENNTIHDFEITDGAHFECIWSNGGNNVTLRYNHFWNCITNGIALNSQDMAGTWIFDNNWWGSNGSANANLKWGLNGSCPSGVVYIRFNSFAGGTGPGNEDSDLTCTNIWYIGNLIGEVVSCESGAQYFYNIYLGSSRCGTALNGNILIGALPYVNTSDGASGDYHLSGAVGSTAADDYVPGSVTNSNVLLDWDGDLRTSPRDAGSDAR
jgi:hypothetical protein